MIVNNVVFVYKKNLYNIYFDCYYVRFLCELTQFAFNIAPPHNVTHMFEVWRNQVEGKSKQQLLANAPAIC
jgi:hypothetical protein